jgi:hypothetical protein
LHFYPELGVAARRTSSRFHLAELRGLVPWLLPTAQELARSAELRLLDERTVAIVWHGQEAAAEAAARRSGRPLRYLRVHLVFGDDGALAERQLVEMPQGRILLRQTYDPTGVVRLLAGDGRQLAAVDLQLKPASPPDLVPDLSSLVVLPLRTRSYVYSKLRRDDNGRFADWSQDEALQLAAAIMGDHGDEQRNLIAQRFLARGDRRIGFYTLLGLAASHRPAPRKWQLPDGTTIDLNPLAEHPDSPLAAYLAWRLWPANSTQSAMRFASDEAVFMGLSPDEQRRRGSSFVYPLARDAWLVKLLGETKPQVAPPTDQPPRPQPDVEQALSFVQKARSPYLAWAVLHGLARRTSDPDTLSCIAQAHSKLYGTPLDHVARYQAAHLWAARGEMLTASQEFARLAADLAQAGLAPPLHATFRRCTKEAGWESWHDLIQGWGRELIANGNRFGAISLAWQTWRLGDASDGNDLVRKALVDPPPTQRDFLQLIAIGYYLASEQPDIADQLLERLLAEPTCGAWPPKPPPAAASSPRPCSAKSKPWHSTMPARKAR